ncbi:hypothetical protein KY290_025736 [Solanum tuberosum]|uniref:Uncharacterized protein n=1 Tax=Solanum tuberosum TaxID=4113 RepID=A0ABQ7UWI0_SOLTU|nr:hypothetical protein KY290_025736 [Solanum tuberosum]
MPDKANKDSFHASSCSSMKVPFQGRTTYYDTFRFVEPCFGLWFDGCLDFFAMIFPVVYIGAIAVSFLFVVMMYDHAVRANQAEIDWPARELTLED